MSDQRNNTATGAVQEGPELAEVRHAVEMLRNGIFDKTKLYATVTAILKRHGGGATKIGGLDPKSCPAVLIALREALPRHLAATAPVFPLQPFSKVPYRATHGHLEATLDLKVIRQMVKDRPNCNWGYRGGEDASMVDIDTKEPKPGRRRGTETWDGLIGKHGDQEFDDPETRVAQTPSDGQHVYVKGDIKTGTGTLGDGVDTRGSGGYVVAPGSYVVANGDDIRVTGFYKWINDKPVADIPWIKERIGKTRSPSDETRSRVVEAEPMVGEDFWRELLFTLNPEDYRDQDEWFKLMCSFHYLTAGQGGDDFKEWCDSDLGYAGKRDFQFRWDSLRVHDKGDTDEHVLYEAVRAAGRDDLVVAAINLKPKLKISATPFVPVDPRSIAPRDWLYGLHYIRKYIVADVSPGGGGKTSNVLVEAISMATGVDLLRVGRMYPRPLRVWYWNGEDPREEVERRVAAICKFYSEPDPDFPDEPPLLNSAALARLGENLFLDTGRSTPIKIATPEGPHGATKIARPLVEALIEEVCAKGIDVLVIDPFVSSHSVSENDNVSIDRVIKEGWVPVAERGNCCVDLVHHTRKIGKGAEFGAADARGASAIVDAARNVRVFNTMTDDEADAYKVPKENRWRYFRVDADKTNMAARGAASPWRYLESVSLDNGRDGFPPDSVGVVTAWEPEAEDPLTTEIERDKILKAALDLFNQGKRVTKTHGNNSIKKMVPAFRKLTGMDAINARDIAAAYEAAVNATPATWCYQDSVKAKHLVAGYFPAKV